MAKALRTIKVTADSDLGHVLDEAAYGPVLLEKDGTRYRLAREPEDIWAGYDPQAALDGMGEAAGSWQDVDAEAFKAFIYRAREEGTRPATRP
ncbi:MAG TPA: hypothetical protein VNL16_04155 [Chloroflexota bacterium]|nr:hypothetical protein [Chloroflexota bacterium]